MEINRKHLYKIIDKDVYVGANVALASNMIQKLITLSDLSLYKVPVSDKANQALFPNKNKSNTEDNFHIKTDDLGTSDCYPIEVFAGNPKILLPLIMRVAENLSIALINSRLFGVDYIKTGDSVLGYIVQDNKKLQEEMNSVDYKRIPNSLSFLFCKIALNSVVTKYVEYVNSYNKDVKGHNILAKNNHIIRLDNTSDYRFVHLNTNIARFQKPELCPETNLMISGFSDRINIINDLFDIMTRFGKSYEDFRIIAKLLVETELRQYKEELFKKQEAELENEMKEDLNSGME